MSASISTTKTGHVGHIKFSSPPLNYASPELLRLIADALEEMDGDADIRCSMLSSEGAHFCAGADLAGDRAITGHNGMTAIGGLYVEAERMFRRKKPLVAAIQGAAIGAGLGLALAADFRVAGPSARFSSNFVRLGFHPGFALTYTLPRAIGVQKANLMTLTAARIKPTDALAWGLIDAFAEEQSLLQNTLELAESIAENAPLALLAVRSTIQSSVAESAAAAMRHEFEQQSQLKRTEDYAEGVASVFERRSARFSGK